MNIKIKSHINKYLNKYGVFKMKTILVVDDALSVLKILEYTLTEASYSVESAQNADEALQKVENKKFDIGVFDVNMPGQNGIDLTKEVLTKPNGTGMKIIILTTESSEKMKMAGKEAGAKGWLIKPFNDADLLTVLGKL
jgi:two-component system chemotaxis response regulator CheY